MIDLSNDPDDEGPRTELIGVVRPPAPTDAPITIETDRILVILAEIDHGAIDEGIITSETCTILAQAMRNQVMNKRFTIPSGAEYEIVDVYCSYATILGVAHRVNIEARLDVEPRLKGAIEAMTRPFGGGVPETIIGALLQYGVRDSNLNVISRQTALDFLVQANGKLVQMHGRDYQIAQVWLHGGDLTGFVMAELHLAPNQ